MTTLTPVEQAQLVLAVHNALDDWNPLRLNDIERAYYLCRMAQKHMSTSFAVKVLIAQAALLVALHGPDWHLTPEACACGISASHVAGHGLDPKT